MSGTNRTYEPLRQTEREVGGQREAGANRNYDALRQTQHEVDARPATTPTPQRDQARSNPYENVEERTEANTQALQAKVDANRITPSDKVREERKFDNQLVSEMKLHDQRLEKAQQLAEAVKAQKAQEQQKEMASGRVPERDGAER